MEKTATQALNFPHPAVVWGQTKLTARQTQAPSVAGLLVASHRPSEGPQAPTEEDLAPL